MKPRFSRRWKRSITLWRPTSGNRAAGNTLRGVQAATRAVELANGRYESGLIDFSVVLDAQRSLLTFQDTLTSSEASVLTDLISLYKALGGGWTSMSPAPTASDEKKS